VLRFCGQHARVGTLFTNKSFLELARSSLQRGLQGVSNVFTQHKPLLHSLIDQALKGKLSEADYPFIGSLPPKDLYAFSGLAVADPHSSLRRSPQCLIIFVVGGMTYSEAALVHEWNSTPALGTVPILIGANTIHNSKRWGR
jgi:vacuolar protein sorting-associated protein 45